MPGTWTLGSPVPTVKETSYRRCGYLVSNTDLGILTLTRRIKESSEHHDVRDNSRRRCADEFVSIPHSRVTTYCRITTTQGSLAAIIMRTLAA